MRFALGTGRRALAQEIATDLTSRIAAQPGCRGVTVFGDDSDGDYGILVLWDSQASAAAAASVIRPILDRHLSGNLQRPAEARLFEVIATAPTHQQQE